MATTHAYMSTTLAVLTLPVTGQYAPSSWVLTVAFVAGLVPDLDLFATHRKTLHFPVALPTVAVACFLLSGTFGGQLLVLAAVAVAAAALHSVTDVLGGPVGYEPWDCGSGRAVYNHVRDRWHAPRRLVRYSGAPEDFVLGAAFGVPVFATPATGAGLDAILAATLVGSGVYAATRRRFSAFARVLGPRVPSSILDRLHAIRLRVEDR